MIKPVQNKKAIITSPYGKRKLDGVEQMHEGIDIAVIGNPSCVPVYATCSGTIGAILNDSSMNCGRAVFVKKDNAEYYCLYFHLASINSDLSVNDKISEGSFIGIMGSSGHSTGQHLHYGHRKSMLSGTEAYNPEEVSKLYK